jgi:transcriptional regulator with XRE-family HTH domain
MERNVFAARLKQLRAEKGVSREKMSEDLFLSRNYIYNIERGYCYPSMTCFFAICEYLDIQPYQFMKFEPETTAKEEELLEVIRGWSNEEVQALIEKAKRMK